MKISIFISTILLYTCTVFTGLNAQNSFELTLTGGATAPFGSLAGKVDLGWSAGIALRKHIGEHTAVKGGIYTHRFHQDNDAYYIFVPGLQPVRANRITKGAYLPFYIGADYFFDGNRAGRFTTAHLGYYYGYHQAGSGIGIAPGAGFRAYLPEVDSFFEISLLYNCVFTGSDVSMYAQFNIGFSFKVGGGSETR